MAKKNHTLLAMLAGAALAGGYLYMKKLNQQNAGEPVPEGTPEEDPGTDYGWKATFTDENGEEVRADEATAELKEEAVKALNEFKETAKTAGAEILAGLKKAYEDMKVAVADAQQAAAERRAEAEEEPSEVDEALEEVKEKAEDAAEDAKEVFEEVKEAAEEKAEEVKEAFEEIKEAVEEKIEEVKEKAEE